MGKEAKLRRRSVWVVVCVLFLSAGLTAGDTPSQPLRTVAQVDLARYAGTWYEVAKLPNPFQKKCVSDTTATYTPLGNGKIKVVNRCKQANGKLDEAEGLARLAAKDGSNAKLEVRFAPSFLSFIPAVWGDYWVLDLAPDYSYALIGEPELKYLWVLARKPTLEEDTYLNLLKKAAEQGYDTSKVVKTKQG